MTTHYSLSLNPRKLRASAKDHAAKLTMLMQPNDVPVLIYRGMSGISAATALSFALDDLGQACGMVYVRKYSEDSHGGERERALPGMCMSQRFVMVFVDDFISTGSTLRKAVEGAAGIADFSEDMFSVCLGDSGGGQCGVKAHTMQAALLQAVYF